MEPRRSLPNAQQGVQSAIQQPGQASTGRPTADGLGGRRIQSYNSTMLERDISNRRPPFLPSTLMPRHIFPLDGEHSRGDFPQPPSPNVEGSDIGTSGSSALAPAGPTFADQGRHDLGASGRKNPLVLVGQHVTQSKLIGSPIKQTQERPAREISIDENYDDKVEDDEGTQDAPGQEERPQARDIPSGGPGRSQVLPENFIDLGSSSSEECVSLTTAAVPMDVVNSENHSDEDQKG